VADLLRIKRRPAGGAAGAPASLLSSEVAFNEVDRTLYYGLDNAGGVTTNIIPIAGSGAFLPLSGGRLSGGLSFGVATVSNPTDMSRHISLFDGWGGFSITGGTLNLVSGGMLTMLFQGATATMGTGVGLYLDHDPVNATEAVPKQYLDNNYSTNALGDARWLPLATGGTVLGYTGFKAGITVGDTTNSVNIILNSASNTTSGLNFLSGGNGRWLLAKNNYPNEDATNAGADLTLYRYGVNTGGQDGAFLGTTFSISRATGKMFLWEDTLQVARDPVGPTEVVTLQYLQNNTISPVAGDARWVNVSGDTMTGQLKISQPDTAGSHMMLLGTTNGVRMNSHAGYFVIEGVDQTGTQTYQPLYFGGSALTFGPPSTFANTVALGRDPVLGMEAVTLQYLQNNYATSAALGNYLPLTGGTVTGNLTVVGTSSFENTAVFYPNNVAGAMAMIVYGQPATTPDTWAGAINFHQSGGDSEFDFINLFSGAVSSFEWWQNNSANQLTRLATMKPNGDFYTLGQVILGSVTPAQDTSAASKWYVDNNTISPGAGDARWVNVSGDTMTGDLNVNGHTTVNRFIFNEQNPGPMAGGGYGALTWNTDGGGDVAFVNGCNWASAGFSWYQVGASTWSRIMYLGNNGNLGLLGVGISYTLGGGGTNSMGFSWTGGKIHGWVDGSDQGALALESWVNTYFALSSALGNYVAKAGDTMTGGLSFGQATAPINAGDTSRHITLYDGFGGFSVTGGTINIVSNGNTDFVDKNGNRFVTISGSGLYMVGNTDINLVRDPSQPLHAATKQYVDGLWVINVKSYGATGNGSTDDTVAINNAVTAAGAGNLVFFPAGTYKITAAIVLPTLVSVSGTGASSIIAPATAGQVAFSMAPTAITETHNTIHDLQISPAANNCIGIKAVFCNHLKIFNVTFSGCVGRSIDLDRCRYYLIENCLIRSSMSFPGGTLLVQSSTWNSSTGGYLGGEGEISNIEFAPMTDSPFGQADPCIQLFSQPGTAVFNCTTSWGAYASGPTTHILIQNQCQGNTIRDNQGEGVFCGIIINDGGGPNSVMPNYIYLENNSYDNVGEIGIFVDGTAAKPADDIVIRGGALTNMHCSCTAATVASGGTGFVVGNIIQGPDVAAQQQGNPVMLQVTSIGAGGAITGVSIYNKGLVQTPPANPVPFHYGSGSGATFNLTYTGMGTGIWLRHVNNAQIDGVFMENYGGVRGGVGMMIESLYNARITGNQITQFDRVLYCQDTAVSNIVFAHNTCWNNNSNDFGGTIPAYSVVRDNIGEIGWIAGTPPVPASGVTVTNTAPYPMQIFIVSGSVSAITYMGDTIPATTTAGMPIILTINRQHTIALTYTVAPGWLWIPME
jgi:hypothetical protein